MKWNKNYACFKALVFFLNSKQIDFFPKILQRIQYQHTIKLFVFFKYTDLVITHTDFICTPKFFLHFIQSALLQSTGFSKRYVVRFWVQVTGNQFINRSIYPMALYFFTQMECKKVAWCFYSALIYSWWYVWSYVELNVK